MLLLLIINYCFSDCSFVLGKTIKFCEDMGQRQSENRQYVDQESKALWEVEMEMMSDLFKRLSNSCHQKCISFNYK